MIDLSYAVRRRQRRAAGGQAIAEGAAIMPVIIMIAVFFIMLLVYVGITFYNWIQLSSVAGQLAFYLAGEVTADQTSLTPDQSADVIAKANKMLPLLNLPTVSSSGDGPMTLACNLTSSPAIAVSLKMASINLFGGKMPTPKIVGTGVGLIGASSRFKYYAVMQGMCAKKNYGNVDWVNTKFWVPCYKSNRAPGSIPAGVTWAGGFGVNCTEESSSNNVWGIGAE
jgi:Flp pilus assembly protein TadG